MDKKKIDVDYPADNRVSQPVVLFLDGKPIAIYRRPPVDLQPAQYPVSALQGTALCFLQNLVHGAGCLIHVQPFLKLNLIYIP